MKAFCRKDDARSVELMQMVDRLNRLYAWNSVFFGSAGMAGTWRMIRDRVTPAYTTWWGV